MAPFLTSPLLLKPRISKLMLDVRPVWISCRCLKRFSLVLPRPLSSSPCVKTPNRVDLPESTLPSTATRKSKNCREDTEENEGGMIVKYEQMNSERTTIPQISCTNLLIIWYFANENFSNLSRHIRVIVHLLLSENSDVGANPCTQKKHKHMSNYKITTFCL